MLSNCVLMTIFYFFCVGLFLAPLSFLVEYWQVLIMIGLLLTAIVSDRDKSDENNVYFDVQCVRHHNIDNILPPRAEGKRMRNTR